MLAVEVQYQWHSHRMLVQPNDNADAPIVQVINWPPGLDVEKPLLKVGSHLVDWLQFYRLSDHHTKSVVFLFLLILLLLLFFLNTPHFVLA